MEPFGLFNLLKTFLPNEPKEAQKTEASEGEVTAPAPSKNEEPSAEVRTEPSCANACAAFLERHEKRASRIKK